MSLKPPTKILCLSKIAFNVEPCLNSVLRCGTWLKVKSNGKLRACRLLFSRTRACVQRFYFERRSRVEGPSGLLMLRCVAAYFAHVCTLACQTSLNEVIDATN